MNIRKKNIPRVNRDSIYSNLKHGDIVFSSSDKNRSAIEHLIMTMNHSIPHVFIVIEENGIKYGVHSYSPLKETLEIQKEYFLNKGMMIFNKYGLNVVVFKEPLSSILCKHYSVYEVFRTNHNIIIPKNVELPNHILLYCCNSIASILVENKIISEDTTLLFSYRPDYIVRELINKGFPSFKMIHDDS